MSYLEGKLLNEVCYLCDGSGGWDISTDCEVYDEWKECPVCYGEGVIEDAINE